MANQFKTTGTQEGDVAAGYINAGVYDPGSGSLSGTMKQPEAGPTGGYSPPAGGYSPPTGDTTASSGGTTAPSGGDPLNFALAMGAFRANTEKNNTMMKQRNLLLKHLYDQPLTDEERKQLDPTLLPAIQSGDRSQIDMSLRLMSDELQGRTNTLDQSLKYLTDTYNTTLEQAETQRTEALNTFKSLATTFKDDPASFAKYMGAMKAFYPESYGPVIEQLISDFGAPADGSITSVVIPTGTIASRTNNPLNIKFSSLMSSFGATDSGIAGTDGGTFSKFNSPEEGFQAASQLLTSQVYSDLSVDAAMKKWSNSGYGAEVSSIDGNKKIGDLSQEELNTLLTDMAKRESGASLQVTPADQQLMPEEQVFLASRTPEQQKVYLSMSAKERSAVQQLIEGKALVSDLPGFAGAEAKLDIMAKAGMVDPTYSPNTEKLRFAFRKRWETGDLWDNRVAINTALGHISDLAMSAKQLSQNTIQKYNTIANMVAKETGDPAITDFNLNLDLLASELARIYKGGKASPTDKETAEMRASIMSNFSPKQFSAIWNKSGQLLASRLGALKSGYKSTMGVDPTDQIIDPDVIDKLVSVGIDPKIIEKESKSTLTTDTTDTNKSYEDYLKAIQ